MNSESDTRRKRALWIAMLLWGAALFMSLFEFATAPATGDGFTHGLNRLSAFLGWQVLAIVLAGVAGFVGLRLPKGTLPRRMSLFPAMASVVIILGLTVLVVSAVADQGFALERAVPTE